MIWFECSAFIEEEAFLDSRHPLLREQVCGKDKVGMDSRFRGNDELCGNDGILGNEGLLKSDLFSLRKWNLTTKLFQETFQTKRAQNKFGFERKAAKGRLAAKHKSEVLSSFCLKCQPKQLFWIPTTRFRGNDGGAFLQGRKG